MALRLITWANQISYDKAKIPHPLPPDFKEPKENVTVELMENILNKVVFAGDERYDTVFVNSQCPPYPESDSRADLAIKYITKDNKLQTLCIIEAKRPRASGHYNTDLVEEEALDYCEEFFKDPSHDCLFVYAATIIGVKIRLWKVNENGRKLEALSDNPYRGTSSHYLDLGENADAEKIIKIFRKMLTIAPEPWIFKGDDSFQPTSKSGAHHLNKIDTNAQKGLPCHLEPIPIPPLEFLGSSLQAQEDTPTMDSAPFPPRNYTKVATFHRTHSDWCEWVLYDDQNGSGPCSEWSLDNGYFVNVKQKLYTGHDTL
ncbi:hypothetical protein P170DRAFT_431552 [Aspergillus steynii IBT 23096]|uniref:Uncharacterized protein n=1 Tax=Aspergillus steynii IBT 23096 TaxID=1392250 RepID=A0A2I2GLI3_9EURO|nr:uncharacterized protein P170DRAFT_431552 [Aspergillus steynii IBT 23096]PLB53740.1 hypothetical protein P170DRAFT_431552 [Aspergillus steynii IBT 23096]